jgi:uncharacterized MAPEG superfamily protein
VPDEDQQVEWNRFGRAKHIPGDFPTGEWPMTIAEWMVLASMILYLLTLAPLKVIRHRDFDNSNPRAPEFYRSGISARVLGAHLNGIETFPFFAFAVLLAEFRHQPQHWINVLALGFVAVRLFFVLAYLANWPTTRTIAWNVGFALNAAIFFLPLWAPPAN